jgi:DNA-binding MarR family transcriptional regulator
MPPPSGKRLAWLRMLEAHTRLVELMEADLQRDCGVPLVWYDIMIKIWVAPGRHLRMAELAEQALLSRSWLTRRVVQLEQAGLVTRTSADEDGRGVLVQMTPRGLKTFARMEESHAKSIARHFSAHVTQEEAGVLSAVFTRITTAPRTTSPPVRVRTDG